MFLGTMNCNCVLVVALYPGRAKGLEQAPNPFHQNSQGYRVEYVAVGDTKYSAVQSRILSTIRYRKDIKYIKL